MTTATWLETEADDPEHVEREDQALLVTQYTTEVVDTAGRVVSSKVQTEPIICSCGLRRCGMVGVFGLPRPLYLVEIAPLPGQPAKDRRAVVLRTT
jgi:hypothetical protein